MTAMSRFTGEILDTADDIRQSVVDILTTPKRTRIMRRAYGAEGFDLIDAPGNAAGALRVIAASADAIARWETRVDMTAGAFAVDRDGAAVIALDLSTTEDASPISVSVPLGA